MFTKSRLWLKGPVPEGSRLSTVICPSIKAIILQVRSFCPFVVLEAGN